MALVDYRIRFAQHDKGSLLQQRQHETFKLLSGGGSSASATIGAHSFMNSLASEGGARTDLLCTASRTPRARMPAGMTSAGPDAPKPDEHVPKEDARFGRKRIIREAARALKAELSKRFGNVYEAYSFLDIDGDWNLSVNELLVGLRRLRIDTSPYAKELSESGVGLIRTLDKHNNSIIDVKTFLSLLAWHPRHPNWAAALEQSRENRLQVKERVEKMLKDVALLETPPPVKVLNSARSAKSQRAQTSSWLRPRDSHDGASDESPSPTKEREVREHLAACAIQKRVRGMQARNRLDPHNSKTVQASVTKRLLLADQPSLGGRKLDLKEQELLANIRAARAQKGKTASRDTHPAIRGRRIDDNLTLPMNVFSLGKTQWLLCLFDYLCVRTDDDGRRTSKIGEGSVCRDISIPDTVIYRQHSISGWFYSDSAGKINMKQHTKEFTPSNILSTFLSADRLHQGSKLAGEHAAQAEADPEAAAAPVRSDEAVAYFVELAGGPGSWRPDNPPGNKISYFTAEALEAFLKRHQKPRCLLFLLMSVGRGRA